MSLLQTQFQLDEIKECIFNLCKNKEMIEQELSQKIKQEKELEAKARRFRKILKTKYKAGGFCPEKQGIEPPKLSKAAPVMGASSLSSTISIIPKKPSLQEMMSSDDEELMRLVNLVHPEGTAKECELKGEMKDKPQSN